MISEDVKKILGAVGVGAGLLGLGLIVYGGVAMYKSYLQTELLKLQIADLTNRINNPALGQAQVIPTN